MRHAWSRPVGLAAGRHSPTDYVIHWSDGHGKTYCVSNLPSPNVFDSEMEPLAKARAFWAKSHAASAKP